MQTATLFNNLKKKACKLTNSDLALIGARFEKAVEFVPEKYKKIYSKDYFTYLYLTYLEIIRTPSIDTTESIDDRDLEQLMEKIERVEEEPAKTFLSVVVPYLVFIAKKPIHPTGMMFPGGEKIICKDGIYYCPAKDIQSGIDLALCDACIALDSSELED